MSVVTSLTLYPTFERPHGEPFYTFSENTMHDTTRCRINRPDMGVRALEDG